MDESFFIVHDRPQVKDSKRVDEHPRTSKAFVMLREVTEKDRYGTVLLEDKEDDSLNKSTSVQGLDEVSNLINNSCPSCNKTLIGILNKKLAQAKTEYKAFNLEVSKREELEIEAKKRQQQQSSSPSSSSYHSHSSKSQALPLLQPEFVVSLEYLEQEMKENKNIEFEIEEIENQIKSLRQTLRGTYSMDKVLLDDISQSQSDINQINFEISQLSDEINIALKCVEVSNKEIIEVVESDKIGDIFDFSPQNCRLFLPSISSSSSSSSSTATSRFLSLSSLTVLVCNAREYMSLSPTVKIDLRKDFSLDLSLIPLLHGPIVSLSFYNNIINRSDNYQETLFLKQHQHKADSFGSDQADANHILAPFFFIIVLIHSVIEMSRTNHLSHGVLQSYNAFRDLGHILLQLLLEQEFHVSSDDFSSTAYDHLLSILFQGSNLEIADVDMSDVKSRLETIFQECIRIILI